MKNTIELVGIAGLITIGAAQAYAQTTNVFLAQNFNVTLNGFTQSPGTDANKLTVTSVRISTKDLVSTLGFPSSARLVVLTPVEGGSPVFVVRQKSGSTTSDTDVSANFGHTTVGGPIEKSTTNTKTGRVTGTQFSIDSFTFGSTDTNATTTISFDVQGFTTSQLPNGNFTSNVNGTGTVTGNDAVLRGTIGASGSKSQTIVTP